jgi:hypothetical protein
MRGASLVSHSGYEVIISFINEKTWSGSFCTFTSMLNLTCWFSGYSWRGEQLVSVRMRTSIAAALTLISNSIVCVNVGMDCFGSLMVRACSMPSGPYQFLSRICPVTGVISGLCSNTISKPFESVVRSKPAIRGHLRFRALMASIGTYLGHAT